MAPQPDCKAQKVLCNYDDKLPGITLIFSTPSDYKSSSINAHLPAIKRTGILILLKQATILTMALS